MFEEFLDIVQASASKIHLSHRWSEEAGARRAHKLQLARLRIESRCAKMLRQDSRIRVAATACWEFPIYSQTFVYQELAQLGRNGFNVRFLYSKLNRREYLPPQFSSLWAAKRKLILHPSVCLADYEYFAGRMPEKVDQLVQIVSRASGMPPDTLRKHRHFLQAFAFSRIVEACRPDYLHSYFFYEGTLFASFASFLLDIPRGVSCYADHMLQDYELKLVPLHLEQCSVVVATSRRIKRELMRLAPDADPERILVKPNAIDATRFPLMERRSPGQGQPFRLVCVSRIEPKKGIIQLLDAVRRLLDRGLPIQLSVVGGVDDNSACREYAGSVKSRIEEQNLRGSVRLVGRQPETEVKRVLGEAHVFVAPFVEMEYGDKDGIPTALLEAMATGLPVVATDAGSITEVVEHGHDGLIVAQFDPGALADAIETILLDRDLRERMGKAAASKVRKQFDVSHCEPLFHRRVREAVGVHRQLAGQPRVMVRAAE